MTTDTTDYTLSEQDIFNLPDVDQALAIVEKAGYRVYSGWRRPRAAKRWTGRVALQLTRKVTRTLVGTSLQLVALASAGVVLWLAVGWYAGASELTAALFAVGFGVERRWF